jgi:hypothetical protein
MPRTISTFSCDIAYSDRDIQAGMARARATETVIRTLIDGVPAELPFLRVHRPSWLFVPE